MWYEVLNMVNDYDLNIFLCLFTWCIRIGIYIIPCEYVNVNPNGGTFKPHGSLGIWTILNGKEKYFETSIILDPHSLAQRLIVHVNTSFDLEYNLHYTHCKCGGPVGLHIFVCWVNQNTTPLEDLRIYLN